MFPSPAAAVMGELVVGSTAVHTLLLGLQQRLAWSQLAGALEAEASGMGPTVAAPGLPGSAGVLNNFTFSLAKLVSVACGGESQSTRMTVPFTASMPDRAMLRWG